MSAHICGEYILDCGHAVGFRWHEISASKLAFCPTCKSVRAVTSKAILHGSLAYYGAKRVPEVA